MFCPPFFHLLEALDISGEGQTSELPPIVSCFVELTRCFQRIRNKSHLRTEDAPLDPTFVYETLAEYATTKSHQQMLSRGTQEDAQESLNHILLLLHEEMVRGIASLTESSTKELTARRAAGSSDEWTSISKGQKKSVIRECDDYRESPLTYVFGGKLRSVRMNNKGAKSAENVEPFFMLDLPIQVWIIQTFIWWKPSFFVRFFDRSVDRSIDWLIDWSIDRSIDWLIDWSIAWSIDWFFSVFLILISSFFALGSLCD